MKMKILISLSLLILLGVSAYYDLLVTLSFLAGVCWGLINLYFIQQLLYKSLIEKPKNLFKIAMLFLVKFPLLYSVGFGLLYYQSEFTLSLMAGFSGVLVLSLQKGFWKVFQIHEKKVVGGCGGK